MRDKKTKLVHIPVSEHLMARLLKHKIEKGVPITEFVRRCIDVQLKKIGF